MQGHGTLRVALRGMKRDAGKNRAVSSPAGLNRRGFMGSVAAIATCAALHEHADARTETTQTPSARSKGAEPRLVRLVVNGRPHDLSIEPRVTLLDALREHLGTDRHQERLRPRPVRRVHGARRRAARQCVPDARVMHEGAKITTVEGLAGDRALHPLQAAFVQRDAFQCGYCTPGQICAATALLDEPTPAKRAPSPIFAPPTSPPSPMSKSASA